MNSSSHRPEDEPAALELEPDAEASASLPEPLSDATQAYLHQIGLKRLFTPEFFKFLLGFSAIILFGFLVLISVQG